MPRCRVGPGTGVFRPGMQRAKQRRLGPRLIPLCLVVIKGGLIPDNNGKEGEQMKKQAYVKPRIVGSAVVHPC